MTIVTRIVTAMAVLILGTAAAVAQEQGWYIGAGAGVTFPDSADISGGAVSTDADFDTGWAGVGSLGYAYGNGLRTEIEVGYRQNDIGDLSGVAGGTGDSDALNAMINGLYDFHNSSDFTPYVGAGIGWLNLNLDGVTPVGGATLDDSDDVLAYQGIVGIGYSLTEQIDLFVDYRYLGTEDASMRTSAGVNVDVEYDSHTVLAGLRIGLTPPPPPPPPEPEPVAESAPPPEPEPAPAPEPAPVPGPYVVFFDWDKSDIRPDAQAVINEAAANALEFGIARIVVTGHADRSGTDAYNLALSQRRADAVRAALIGQGIAEAEIGVFWKGEAEPLVPTEDGVREPQNRRVEIVYE
jgi:outer membrane protein OmpA-like peptidoglycan-associated protein